eukprot:10630851-Alexandrium_andersonii.AAC.1
MEPRSVVIASAVVGTLHHSVSSARCLRARKGLQGFARLCKGRRARASMPGFATACNGCLLYTSDAADDM